MIKKITRYKYTKGKIKRSILITSLFIVLFFIFVEWINIYNYSTLSLSSNIRISTITPTTTTTGNITATSTSTTVIVPPKLPQNIGHAVGISVGGGLSKTNISNINQQLDQMVKLGVTWVRFDIEWGNVQYSSPDNSTWNNYDIMVNALVAHHLHGLGIILFTPEWARDPKCGGGAKCPPQTPAQYATFAAQVAARYKGKVDAWEIWNEPNNYDFWATKTDCGAYTALLKITYLAIKKADPNALIITGGVAPAATDNHNISRLDFLSCIYKNGGKNYFDAVGDHPYTFPKLPSSSNTNAWVQMYGTSPSLRSIMIANGDANKKIWMTEFGAPTNGPDSYWYMSEADQANMVTDAMSLYKTYDWAGPIFWYTLKDGGTTTDTIENFFGLTRTDDTLKPAFNTLKDIITRGL